MACESEHGVRGERAQSKEALNPKSVLEELEENYFLRRDSQDSVAHGRSSAQARGDAPLTGGERSASQSPEAKLRGHLARTDQDGVATFAIRILQAVSGEYELRVSPMGSASVSAGKVP